VKKKTIMLRSAASMVLLLAATSVFASGERVNIDPNQSIKHIRTASKFAPKEVIITFKAGKRANRYFNQLLTRFLGRGKYTTHTYTSLGAMHIKSDRFSTARLISIFRQSVFSSFL